MAGNVCYKRRGFTLIELVTIMVIIGILAVFVMPRMFDVTSFRKRGYFDQLIEATRYANKLSVTTDCAVQVTINAASFSLAQPVNGPPDADCSGGVGATWASTTIPGTNPQGGIYSAPSGVTTSVAAQTLPVNIIFSPDGTVSGATNYTVTVTGSDSSSFIVYYSTGYVQRQ